MERIAHLKDKLLGDKDSAFARANPKLFDGITKLVTLLEEEQNKVTTGFEEIKEQAKMVSVGSMLQLRRTQAYSRKKASAAMPSILRRTSMEEPSSSDSSSGHPNRAHSFDEESTLNSSPPIRQELLVKQGKDQIWRERYFVLRSEGVYYYDNTSAWRSNPQKPKARILFRDLICPSGQAADEVPRFVYLVLGRPFVFCLHSESDTFVVSASTREVLRSWVAAINSAFNTYILNQAKRTALLDAVDVVGSPEVWKVVNRLMSGGNSSNDNSNSMDQVLGELFQLLLDTFEREVCELYELFRKKRALQEWREAAHQRRQHRLVVTKLEI